LETTMRIIPILGQAQVDSSCDEGTGEVPKLDLPLARRDFLKGSGILMGTIATGTALAALAPSPVWALELKKLNADEGKALMAMGRVLYPHKKLSTPCWPKTWTAPPLATQARQPCSAPVLVHSTSFAKAAL
jgi:hypothetical protein